MAGEQLQRKPEWLKVRFPGRPNYLRLKGLMRHRRLHTVCEEARCPNVHECWGKYRTASFMILGDTCTRRCRFCAVKTGRPGAVDPMEPLRIAGSVEKMNLRHVHITMVNRDDLEDGGAGLMAATVHSPIGWSTVIVQGHHGCASVNYLWLGISLGPKRRLILCLCVVSCAFGRACGA